ncbi:hypothetical protein J2S00_003883 [Caldalkalibacillus uzonensis]|uniref:AbrB/MazE/SpoVT family DNA-binding domain-containing protein n=1 Tax=Caldalkalibacillus uzonensis TaxID=353224 RepID=A0ABU0CY17_9BACI|nr:hypothetical protein [Caldalkalibacillus uzonensis]MDQ0341039.1 hypothetical protein [Caldalkalibacillus uzonensis]
MFFVMKSRFIDTGDEIVFSVSKVRLVSLQEEVEKGERLLDLNKAEVLLKTASRNEALRFADQKAAEFYGGWGSEL